MGADDADNEAADSDDGDDDDESWAGSSSSEDSADDDYYSEDEVTLSVPIDPFLKEVFAQSEHGFSAEEMWDIVHGRASEPLRARLETVTLPLCSCSERRSQPPPPPPPLVCSMGTDHVVFQYTMRRSVTRCSGT